MSLFNLPLFKNTVKGNLVISKASLLIFLGFFILSIIEFSIRYICMVVFVLSSIILTTAYPCIIQGYFIDKIKSTLIKSLPLDTKCIWFTNYLSGYLIVLVTLLIEGIGLILLSLIEQDNYFFDFSTLANYRFILMIFVLLFIYYTIVFLFSSIAGNRLGQVVFSIFGYTFPVIILISLILFTEYLVPCRTDLILQYSSWLFPIISAMEYIQDGSNLIIFFHFFIALIFLVLSYFVYKNRDDEYIGEPLVYSKIVLLFKAGVVLGVTTLVFYLIVLLGKLDISLGSNSIILLLLVYLIIGIIVGIIVETIFKNQHIYRKIAIYVGILIASFSANYFVANNIYERGVSSILEESNVIGMMYSNDSTFGSIEFEGTDLKDLVNWLDNNRENIKRDNDYNGRSLISLYIYDEDGPNSNTYTYTFTKHGFVKYFNQRGNDYFNDLVSNFRNEKYLNVYFDNKHYYLNSNQVNKLYQMCKDQSLKVQDYIDANIINLVDFEGKSYFIKNNERVKEFIINECSSQTELINKCDEFLNDENNYLDTDISLIKNYIEENYNIKNINDLYFTGYQMLDFDETQVSYLLELSATSENDSYSGNIIIDLKEIDNEIVIASIREGE